MISTVVEVAAAASGLTAAVWMAAGQDRRAPWLRHMIPALAASAAVWMGMSAVMRQIPPVDDVGVLEVERAAGVVVLAVAGNVQRAECAPVGTSSHTLGEAGRHTAAITRINSTAPNGPRPAGRQWLGDWEVRLDEAGKPRAVSITKHYDCGWLLGMTSIEYGPFPIGKPPSP